MPFVCFVFVSLCNTCLAELGQTLELFVLSRPKIGHKSIFGVPMRDIAPLTHGFARNFDPDPMGLFPALFVEQNRLNFDFLCANFSGNTLVCIGLHWFCIGFALALHWFALVFIGFALVCIGFAFVALGSVGSVLDSVRWVSQLTPD